MVVCTICEYWRLTAGARAAAVFVGEGRAAGVRESGCAWPWHSLPVLPSSPRPRHGVKEGRTEAATDWLTAGGLRRSRVAVNEDLIER